MMSLTTVDSDFEAFVTFGAAGEVFFVPAFFGLSNGDSLDGFCFSFVAEGTAVAVFVFFAVEALLSTETECMTFLACFLVDVRTDLEAAALPPCVSVESNSEGFACFFTVGGVLAPAVGFFGDNDRQETTIFSFEAGGAFFAVFDFLATGTLRAVDEVDLAFLFALADGEGPVVEAVGLAPASFAADDLVVFTTLFTDGDPFAVSIFDAFDPGTSFSLSALVPKLVFFALETGTAAIPLVNLESGAPKYAVKGRCCNDILMYLKLRTERSDAPRFGLD